MRNIPRRGFMKSAAATVGGVGLSLVQPSHVFGSAANSAMDLMNADGMEVWTRAAGMRYQSRRDMLEITTNPAFSGSHDFKIAAMKKTIAFPIDPWFQLGDPRLVLALILGLIGCLLSWRTAASDKAA